LAGSVSKLIKRYIVLCHQPRARLKSLFGDFSFYFKNSFPPEGGVEDAIASSDITKAPTVQL